MPSFPVGLTPQSWPINTTTPGQSQVTNPSTGTALYVTSFDSGGAAFATVKVQPGTTAPIAFPAGGTVRAYAGVGLTTVPVT